MVRGIIPLILISSVAVSALGQSTKDLAGKYSPISAYEVRPGILMLVEFDAGGNACEMTLERSAGPWSDSDAVKTFSDELADELLDELAPSAIRGPAHVWLNSDSFVTGGMYFLKQDYENISVERLGSFGAGLESVKIIWTKRRCQHPTSSPRNPK